MIGAMGMWKALSFLSTIVTNGNESVYVATCMKNGSNCWSPDPHTYKCDTAEIEVTSKAEVLTVLCSCVQITMVT